MYYAGATPVAHRADATMWRATAAQTMLTKAQNGLPAGEVSWFEQHALNIP